MGSNDTSTADRATPDARAALAWADGRDVARQLSTLLGRLQRGASDPSLRRVDRVWFRAVTTPDGPALLRLAPDDDHVDLRAWGPGAGWAIGQAPRLLGVHDDPAGFAPDHPLLAEAQRRTPIRLGATDLLVEAIVPTVIEQRVTGAEAFTSIGRLVRRFGSPAPGPARHPGHPAHGLHCPPTAEQWLTIPSWEHTRAGVDATRTRAHQAALHRISALERIVTTQPDALDAALRSLPGIGAWTAAKVRQRVLGDPDAWSIDDYHVPGVVARALGGPGTPASQASTLLEPFVGHRYRVELLLWAGHREQRHGPRRAMPTHLPTGAGFSRRGRTPTK